MTVSMLVLIVMYTLVLLINACDISREVCESYGFGETADGERGSRTATLLRNGLPPP